MSKEEFLKIQTCVLKVNIHCDGCKQKVKKILQKIDGVYTTNIDSEQGKVTVSGNVDPATLIKKLTKNGKHAEIWGASKANNNNQNQMNNQFKNLQIDNGGKGGKNKGQAPKGGGSNQPKGGLQAQNPQLQQQLQQLQQLQQFKGLQDLKMPPQFMKDLKVPVPNNNKDQNQKSVKFNLPEDEGFSDDDFDDDFDDDDYDDDFDDEVDDIPVVNNKMKPPVLANGHGGAQMDNMMMNNIMNGQYPQLMKGGGNGGNNGGNGGGNGKKGGGGGNMPVQMNLGGGNQNQGGANGGKKGGNGNNNGGNQNQGGGKGGKNGGGQPNDGKNGGGGQNKSGGGGGAGAVNGNNSMGNGAKKGGGVNDGPHGMPNMMPMSAGGNVGPLGTKMQMRQMGNLPMGQMNNLAAVQGLPASAMTGGGGGGAGYFPATTPEHMTANPYYQQQLAAMMMNQQRANGNERFQPMMYARPPPAVNYMPPYPPYPYPHPYAPPQGERTDQYTMFSDEDTSSCNVM